MEGKIALIGCGRFGANHLKALGKLVPREQLVAADPDPARLSVVLPGVAKTYADHRQMLKEVKDLRAAWVVCPTIHHGHVAADCLRAGLDVFVEKPLALTSREARTLVALARKKDQLLVPGHLFLYKKAYTIIRSTFDREHPGTQIVSLRFNNGPAILDEGAVFDLAVHDIYLALNLVGTAPLTVYATGTRQGGALVGATLRLAFPQAVATLAIGWTALASTREMRILNGRREFFWRDSDPQTLVVRTAHEDRERRFGQNPVSIPSGATAREETITDLAENTLAVEDAAFLQALTDRKPPVGPDEGALTVTILEKAQTSIKKGKEVKI
jgi:predicted dehydrogenase